MAAFSHHFLLDSVIFPNTTIKIPGFSEEPNTTTTTTSYSQFYQIDPLPLDVSVVCLSNNETSLTYKQSTEDSSSLVVDKIESGDQVTQNITPMDKKRKNRDGSSSNSAQSKDPKEVKGKKAKKCNSEDKLLKKPKAVKKGQGIVSEELAPPGYIHVRARRGQATDSHSLAERVRREKISERMKLLQALVPGCDKVTGKALMLDEIINYVQSLQNQVEFLSMKLASANPMFYDFGVDLDAFMVRPDQRLSNLASPMQNVQQNTNFTSSNYPLVDSSSSILFQQGQRPNVLSQDNNGQLLCDVEDQRQKLINQTCFSNNLCAFQ